MRRVIFWTTVLAATSLAFSCQQASAELVYTIGVSGPSQALAFTNVKVEIYLEELATNGEATLLGDPAIGLISGGFRLQTTAGGATEPVGVTGNPSFDLQLSSSYGWQHASVQQQDVNGPLRPFASLVAPSTYRLSLGFVDLAVRQWWDPNQTPTPQETTFSISDFDSTPGADDIILGNGAVLDDILQSSDYSIASVPEPTSSLGIIALCGAISVAMRNRLKAKRWWVIRDASAL